MVQDATPSLLHGGKVACLRRGLLLWFPGERDTSAVPWKPTLACVAASVEMGHEETHAPQQTRRPETERPPRGGLSQIGSGFDPGGNDSSGILLAEH